jgi:hypothetical protein
LSANNGVQYNSTTGTFGHNLSAGTGIAIAANGLVTNLGFADTTTIRSALSANNGIEYNSTTGTFGHNLSAGTGIAIAANGLIVSTVSGFSGNTNGVVEGSLNLYFTNARAIAALTGGFGIAIAANGMIRNSVDQDVVNVWSRIAISATNGVQYNSGTGVIQHNMTGGSGISVAANGMIINNAPDTGVPPSQGTIRTYISATNGVQYNSGTGVIQHNLVAGTGISIAANGLVVNTVTATAPTAGTGITVTGSTVAFNGAVASINTNVRALSVGSAVGQTFTDGEIRAGNDITAYYSSDKRLKTNIQVIENALDKLDLINGITFDWTDDYIDSRGGEDPYFIRRNDVGVLADELEIILPQLVGIRDDGYKAVKYDRITALLIQAIKELRIEVNDLKKQINKG